MGFMIKKLGCLLLNVSNETHNLIADDVYLQETSLMFSDSKGISSKTPSNFQLVIYNNKYFKWIKNHYYNVHKLFLLGSENGSYLFDQLLFSFIQIVGSNHARKKKELVFYTVGPNICPLDLN